MDQKLIQIEQVWHHTHDGPARIPYRTFMRVYEMTLKTSKKVFYATASIAFVNSQPAQLFKTIQSLTSLLQGKQNINELANGWEAFVNYLADKILSFHDLLITVDIVNASCLSSGLILDHFSRLSQEDGHEVLAAMNLTTCPLDLYSSWLVKVCGDNACALLEK